MSRPVGPMKRRVSNTRRNNMCAQYGKVPQCELWQSKYLKQDKYLIE